MQKNLNIKKLLCPVCENFYFEPLTNDEIEDGITSDDVFCTVCGWNYDEEQLINYDLRTQLNSKSINEYKEWYKKQIEQNPNFNFLDSIKPEQQPVLCPICGKHNFSYICSYEICPYCGWENDGSENDSDESNIGVNNMTADNYKLNYIELVKHNPNYKWNK